MGLAKRAPGGPALTDEVAELFPAQGEWSEDDYFALPDSNRIIELSDGKLEMVEMPTDPHQAAVGQLLFRIMLFLQQHKIGFVRTAPLPVRLWPGKIREPDLVFMAAEREDRIAEEYWGVPDLAVEVHSPGTRRLDRVIKKEEFARAGIREYWRVDTTARTIEVYRLEADAFELVRVFGPSDTLTSAVLPDIQLKAGEVFEAR